MCSHGGMGVETNPPNFKLSRVDWIDFSSLKDDNPMFLDLFSVIRISVVGNCILDNEQVTQDSSYENCLNWKQPMNFESGL